MQRTSLRVVLLVALAACSQAKPPATAAQGPAQAAQRRGELPVAESSVTAPVVSLAQPGATEPEQAALVWRRSEVANLTWGDGPLQVGRVRQGEQNPEAPMAFDVDLEGNLWMLDQVNQRLLVLDGKGGSRSLPVGRTVQDVLVDAVGAVWTLDRLVAKNVTQRDSQSGAVLQTVALASAKIVEGGMTTGLFVQNGSVFVELEHTALRRVAGTPAPDLRNRPTADGKWLLAALRVPPDKVAVAGRSPTAGEDQAPGLALQGQFKTPVAQIVELAGDLGGRVWLAADLVQVGPDDKPLSIKREALAWNADGQVVAHVELCAPLGPEEQFRTVRVKPGGSLYNMCRGPSGVVVERWAP